MGFVALVTRIQLAEMLAPTYAELRNVDPNEAYGRLEDALHDLRLINGIQRAMWSALIDEKPDLDDRALIDYAGKRLTKRKTFKALTVSRASEGALAAATILIDQNAGVSTGEAIGLLETDEGQALLQKGFGLIGAHLAGEVTR